jgi:2-polyprenyl-3-methyl-5-hydroxy-6-metoxy-1,4-benzoquinol methylase
MLTEVERSSREDELAEALLHYLQETQSDFYDDRRIQKSLKTQLAAEDDAGFVSALTRRIGTLRDADVLEIGSGSGWRSIALAKDGARVTGVELLASGVRAAELRKRRHDGLEVTFTEGRAEALPFNEGDFDAVLSFQVIEHVEDIDVSLREMYRVLRPGGFVYLETGNSLYPREEHYRIFWPPGMPKPIAKLYARLRGKNPIHVDHVHFIYRGAILRRMRRAGFSSVRDLYRDFVHQQCADYEAVAQPVLRRLLRILAPLSLNRAFGTAIAWTGFYPGLFLFGEKPK